MFARLQGNPPPFVGDVGDQRRHPGILQGHPLPFQGVGDAPVDHLADGGHFSQLFLELGVGLRVGVGGVGMALVAGDGVGSQGRVGKDLAPLFHDAGVLRFPERQILFRKFVGHAGGRQDRQSDDPDCHPFSAEHRWLLLVMDLGRNLAALVPGVLGTLVLVVVSHGPVVVVGELIAQVRPARIQVDHLPSGGVPFEEGVGPVHFHRQLGQVALVLGVGGRVGPGPRRGPS